MSLTSNEIDRLVDIRVQRAVHAMKMSMWLSFGDMRVYRQTGETIVVGDSIVSVTQELTVDNPITTVRPPRPFTVGDPIVVDGELRIVSEAYSSGYSHREAMDEDTFRVRQKYGMADAKTPTASALP